MTPEKFAEAVRNRANQRVKERIFEFRKAVFAAAYRLLNRPLSPYTEDFTAAVLEDDVRALVAQLSSNNTHKGWPAELWRKEEEAVRKELFGIMDEVQKALLAPPPGPDDPTPAEAEKTTTESK